MDARRESEPTLMKNRTTTERKSDREMVITRTFDAPARIVFEAWTRPELLQRWWAPKALGVYFVFFKKVHLVTDKGGNTPRFRKRDAARVFASGFLINTLNPGIIIFWLGNATVLAVDHTLQERIVIFSVCLLINMAADVGKVMMAGKLRSRLTLRALSIINKISGTILIGFGIALLWGVIFFGHKLR